MIGIVSVCCVPGRAENCEQSEMITQFLLGERVELLIAEDNWLHVRNCIDKYEAWVDRKMISLLDEKEEELLAKADFRCTQRAIYFHKNKEARPIVGGSFIPFINGEALSIANIKIELTAQDPLFAEATHEKIVERAKQYLNAPYLWGGKTILGIDCSGLTQVVYAMCGIFLPRDAHQQVNFGKTVDFLSEAKAGDLAFFENKTGKITHVGILLNSHEIIHASGWVKIDSIDSQGILSTQSGTHSHQLRIIKRLQ